MHSGDTNGHKKRNLFSGVVILRHDGPGHTKFDGLSAHFKRPLQIFARYVVGSCKKVFLNKDRSDVGAPRADPICEQQGGMLSISTTDTG